MSEADTGEDDELGLHATVRAPSSPPRAPHDDADQLVGRRLDHFRIERPLGKGAMGAVYEARDLSLDRPVAIKMIRGSFDNPLEHERLIHEARAQARLNHPNIVHIHYIGDASLTADGGDGTFLAMELVDGCTMGQLLNRGERLDAEEARKAMLQIARGLRAAQREGFIHRDIKPCNLLMDRDGTLKLTDFGLARQLDPEGVSSRTDGTIVGSPEYMSPEQGTLEPVDHRSDMYSIGATFYHLLTGRRLFEGDSVIAIIQQHLSSPVPPLPPDLPPALGEILRRLLAKRPEDRFDTYDDLIAALQAAAPSNTAPAGLWVRLASTALELFFAAFWVSLLGGIGLALYLAHAVIGQATMGQTLAQYALRLQATRSNGARLGLGRSALRIAVALWMPLLVAVELVIQYGPTALFQTVERIQPLAAGDVQSLILTTASGHPWLSALYFLSIGIAAIHPSKRALHDLLLDTMVRYRLDDATRPSGRYASKNARSGPAPASESA